MRSPVEIFHFNERKQNKIKLTIFAFDREGINIGWNEIVLMSGFNGLKNSKIQTYLYHQFKFMCIISSFVSSKVANHFLIY